MAPSARVAVANGSTVPRIVAAQDPGMWEVEPRRVGHCRRNVNRCEGRWSI